MTADCQQPGCTGTYEPDGFCGVCGFQRPYDEQSVALDHRPTGATGPTLEVTAACVAQGN